MTLSEISSWINQSLRFKLKEAQIIKVIDACHKLCFDEDLEAFVYWDNNLTIYQQLNYTSAATDPDDDDVGQTVTGGTSGSTGTLITYDTTEKYIVIETDDDFTAGEDVTSPEGMDITLESSEHQEGYKGPYDWPTSPPVRKMWGITTMKDARLYGVDATYLAEYDDYGVPLDEYNERYFFQKARLNKFDETLTFVVEPNTTDTYRWVYYRYPQDITDLSAHDSRFLIPDRYHMQFIKLCIRMANVTTEDGNFNRSDIEELMFGWWGHLKNNYTPMGRHSNMTNEGNVP